MYDFFFYFVLLVWGFFLDFASEISFMLIFNGAIFFFVDTVLFFILFLASFFIDNFHVFFFGKTHVDCFSTWMILVTWGIAINFT